MEAKMPNQSTPRIVDAHIHVWTNDFEKYPLASSVKEEDLRRWPKQIPGSNLPSFTPEDYFSYSRQVDDVRINLVQMIWYDTDHSYILDLIANNPDTYAGTGIISLDDPEPDKTMIELSKRGCFAFREPPSKLEHPAFEKLFTAGAEHELALSFNMGVDLLPKLDRLCQRFPDTPVILDHVCHVGIKEAEYSKSDLESLLSFSKHKRVLVKIGPLQALCSRRAPYFDVLPLIQEIVGAYGAHRCMWESDSGGPITMSNPDTDYPASIALIRDHADFLTSSEKNAILWETAEGFFFRNR